jgi:hypothetical protein
MGMAVKLAPVGEEQRLPRTVSCKMHPTRLDREQSTDQCVTSCDARNYYYPLAHIDKSDESSWVTNT